MSEKSLLSYLNTLAEREPNKRLLGGPAGWMNAAELYCAVERLGRAFLSLGLKPGDLAALRAERGVETALAIFALRAAGALTVLCSPKQTVEETLSACEAEIRPRAFIERCAAGFSVRIDGQERFVSLNEDADAALPEISPLDPAFVIFTSGSTGKSRAVVQCEQNHISNLLDSQPLGARLRSGAALRRRRAGLRRLFSRKNGYPQPAALHRGRKDHPHERRALAVSGPGRAQRGL